MQVNHFGVGVLLQQVITHCMHQVSLTQANTAVQKKRVVAMLGIVGNLPGSGSRQLVGFALDEIFEGKGPVQVAGVLEPTLDLHGTLDTRLLGFTGVSRQRLEAWRLHGRRRSAYCHWLWLSTCSSSRRKSGG